MLITLNHSKEETAIYKKLSLLLAIVLCLSLALCACASVSGPGDTTPGTLNSPMPQDYDQILQNLIISYPWKTDILSLFGPAVPRSPATIISGWKTTNWFS